ncbi:MAG: glycosyltransferase family 1 protein [Clostridium sp.]|nr:glycosyltransferase family 1 protein [Clostridium sp.]
MKDKNINILIINTVPYRVNGMSTIIMNLYKYMDKSNIKFDFIVNNMIEKIYADEITANNDRYFILKNRNKNPFSYIKNLSKIIKDGQYDIVHIHGNSALMQVELEAVKKSKIKCKTIVHAHNTSCDHKILHKVLYKRFIKSYDLAMACGDAAGKWLYGNRDFIVMKNGRAIDEYKFNADIRKRIRSEFNLNDNIPVFGHVGTFNEQKNHTYLLEVYKEIHNIEPNAVFFMIGDGVLKSGIEKKVNEYGMSKNVIFTGNINNIAEVLQAMDAMIFPSLHEGMPLVLVEWQLSGLPCLISDAITRECIFFDKVISMSLSASPENWARRILNIIENNNRAEDSYIAVKNIKKAGFDICDSAKKLREIYLK